jgi:hypothetical protein
MTHKYDCSRFDEVFDRKNLDLLKNGKGSKISGITPE